ncbi:MAG: LysR family transcriptional regulator, partial [Pseudomonadota bacterium]
WHVSEQLRSGELVRIMPGYQSDESMISAVYLNRKFLPPKSRAFIDFFSQRFSADPIWEQS